MFNYNRLITFLGFILAAALLFSACGSDHDHGPTPGGLNLLVNGDVVATQEGTSVTYTGGADAIMLMEGDVLEVQVQFFLEDGEPYNYTTDDGYSLRYNKTDASVISVEHPINNDEWSFELTAVSEGNSEVNFELWHVDHSDFDSRNFAISVSAAAAESN